MAMVQRFITPEKLISARCENGEGIPRWDAAIICFRNLKGSQALIEALYAKPFNTKVFWGMEATSAWPYIYTADVNGEQIAIITRCIWGGPQVAILVEELSEIGVQFVIGFGAAGSLDPSLPQGTQLVIRSALATDGTSKHYGVGPFKPDRGLQGLVPSAAHVTAATVDAVYRETTELLGRWKGVGAQVINMEAAPFYAAANACGIRAVWLGHVSDLLIGEWKDWYVDRQEMNDGTIENCLAVIRDTKTDEQAHTPGASGAGDA